MNIYKGDFIGQSKKVAIVAAEFNEVVTQKLVSGARENLTRHGVKDTDIDVYWVPGAFEISFAVQKLLKNHHYDGIMTLGAVIKGQTDHYDLICSSVANSIAQLNLTSSIPVTFGVLTTHDLEQAVQRAGAKAGNEGTGTAESLLEMMSLNEQL